MPNTEPHLFEVFLLNEAEIAGVKGDITIKADWANAQIDVSFAAQVGVAVEFCERANQIIEQDLSTHVVEDDYTIGASIPLTSNDTVELLNERTSDLLAENIKDPAVRKMERTQRTISANNGTLSDFLIREIGHRRWGADLPFNPTMPLPPA